MKRRGRSWIQSVQHPLSRTNIHVLGGEGLVVHKEEIDVAGVVYEESLVAGGHHVASLLVGTETNLRIPSAFVLSCDPWQPSKIHLSKLPLPKLHGSQPHSTYRWHDHLTLEPSSDSVVNTLGLSP